MTSSATASPPVVRSKPPAKLLSPACRNLFGNSEPSAVTQLLNEILVADRRRAKISLNFDIQKEEPLKQEQQIENVAEMDKTPEQRRRYHWKQVRDADVPDFYSRRYKGKKSLMPVDLLACNDGENMTSPQNGRSRTVRRSLNGFLRSSPRPLSPKTTNVIIRPASASKLSMSPLTLSAHTDSPVAFDDSYKARVPSVHRPMPLHAPSENVNTTKTLHQFKPISPQVSKSPVTLRKNINSPRYLDSPDRMRGTSQPESRDQTNNLTSPAENQSVPTTPSQSLPQTPAQIVPVMPVFGDRSLKQQKITDQFKTVKKQRPAGSKTRKRLTLTQDESSGNLSPKIPRLSQ